MCAPLRSWMFFRLANGVPGLGRFPSGSVRTSEFGFPIKINSIRSTRQTVYYDVCNWLSVINKGIPFNLRAHPVAPISKFNIFRQAGAVLMISDPANNRRRIRNTLLIHRRWTNVITHAFENCSQVVFLNKKTFRAGSRLYFMLRAREIIFKTSGPEENEKNIN